MTYRKSLRDYRLAREAIMAVVGIGMALLFSYLILRVHF